MAYKMFRRELHHHHHTEHEDVWLLLLQRVGLAATAPVGSMAHCGNQLERYGVGPGWRK